jgi:DNA repair protein RadC
MAEEKRKNIHAGHRSRMRERFMNGGLDSFEPHEVLELLLFEYIPVVNTNPHAHALIERFGSVKNVLTAPYEELLKIPGIGPVAAEGIRSVYPFMSEQICEFFRKQGLLTHTDLAFLGDWFMDHVPAGSMGLILCGNERRFLNFVYLYGKPGDTLLDMAGQIVRAARGTSYYLLVKEDFSLITRENAQILRQVTGRGRAYMLDVFVLEGYHPTSIYDI